MRVPIQWLSDYVALRLPVSEIARRLTMAGIEVTGIETTGESWDGVVVGHVQKVEPHPDADRLQLVTVETGGALHQVVCGAPNVAEGQKIAYAGLGVMLVDARTGKKKSLKRAMIRGVVSEGMVCSERELGISEEHEGILVLPESAPTGRPLSEALGDRVLVVDMKPNRADGLSILGVARDVAALTGEKLREREPAIFAEGPPVDSRASAAIEAPDLCARFTLALIKGIEIGPSPPWMQERLRAAGMRPINNVVDITNYVMLELGQPIHAFDYDKIPSHRIIVRRARPGETLTTLDGKERSFTEEQLLITDPSGPVAVAGVMGGLATEVSETTKNVLLEVANFDPVSIRRTAMALKLPSEASRRFAWGIAPELAPIASRRAIELLVEHTGGLAARGIVDVYPRPSEPVTVNLPRKRVPQVLGIDPPEETIVSSLVALGFEVEATPTAFSVQVPYWRRDVAIADDVVEEIARMVGYDEIPAEPLTGRIPPHVVQPVRELRERVRDVLVRAGMQEVMTYPLTSLEVLARVVPEETLEREPPLAVINPLNAGEERMRTTLRASLLECLARNLKQERGRLALFETARVYRPKLAGLPEETEHVVGVVAGARLDRWGRASDEGVDFYDAKAYVERLFEGLGVPAAFRAAEEHGLLSGRTAELVVGEDQGVGVLGQVHPQTAHAFGITDDAFLFEVRIEELLPLVAPVHRFEAFSRFPAVVEDLALVLDPDQPAAAVIAEIEEHPLVASARVFDVYQGEQIPKGKKSLALSVAFQTSDRTLTDADVAAARETILDRLRSKLGAELRQ